jgi:hypothetical protein
MRIHTDRRVAGYRTYGRQKRCTGCWWRELKERNHLEDLGVDCDNIKIDLQEVGWRGAWTGSMWLWRGAGSGPRECGNEPSGYVQSREFLEDREILVQFTLYVLTNFSVPPKSQIGLSARPDSYWTGARGEAAETWNYWKSKVTLSVAIRPHHPHSFMKLTETTAPFLRTFNYITVR